VLANIIMVPLGILMIRAASYVLRAPRAAVMPVILPCCAVGSFAVAGNNPVAVVIVAVFGVLGYIMETIIRISTLAPAPSRVRGALGLRRPCLGG